MVIIRKLKCFTAGLALLGLAGCQMAARDSWDDPGSWRARGANEMNLQAMIANPNDLIAGRGDRGTSAVIATTAVNRYLTDKIKTLPTPGGVSLGSGGGGGGAAGGQAVGPQ